MASLTPENTLQESLPALSPHDVELARTAEQCIMASLDHSRAAKIILTTTDGAHPAVELPPASLKIIGKLLGLISERRAFSLVPAKQEFSTVQAAQYLNVSRPFVIKEIEAGRLPYRMVGTHRRIAFEDLVNYGREMRRRQEEALDRMAQNARELGLDTN